MATFNHPYYDLVDGDRIVRKASAPQKQTMAENEELCNELARYVEEYIMTAYDFVPIPIPDDDDITNKTSILASRNWTTATKILVIINNASGSLMGIFSRSTCMDAGLSKGSMIPYIERALSGGYAVLVLRPNTNSTFEVDGSARRKVPIKASESAEIHALYVFENIIPQAESVTHIALLGYGNGASLCKDLFLRQMVRKGSSVDKQIKAVVTVEASHIAEDDDAVDFKGVMRNIVVNLEMNNAVRGSRLAYRDKKLGCSSLSLGLLPGQIEKSENVAASIVLALDPVFLYLQLAESTPNPSKTFASAFARECGIDPVASEVKVNPNATEDVTAPPPPAAEASPAAPPKQGVFSRMSSMFSSKDKSAPAGGAAGGKGAAAAAPEGKLAVTDFDLLKVVGKGAFGKVMLVRKKAGTGAGQIYAMKVLVKQQIAALGQIEHTKSERDILFIIKHPFIVQLRFSFQNESKLYLVTDYYNGGSLYDHLRKSKFFTEERAKFYGAELLSALDHLHQKGIVYRDLKLENILMDHVGHIALTDFGLSKQDIDKTGGATTFCGTAEYIAPELLNNQKYGKAVDWWSFGILMFEMMCGSTPFYDKNRKLLFYKIMHREPNFPSTFSQEAIDCITGLLRKQEQERLGAGEGGARNIMATAYFSVIDFEALLNKEIKPPFTPEVKGELDTAYVSSSLVNQEARDSATEKPKKKGDAPKFDQFTYVGDSAMGGDR